ncbi:MAG: hypothetical protein MK319_13260 [Pseudomonadales bacterium]|nr:hypothetical protein [Pseudomonadales bacterium]
MGQLSGHISLKITRRQKTDSSTLMLGIKKAFIVGFCVVLLAGCGSNSTGSGITQGTDTGSFSGAYEGTLELKVTADAIGTSPKSDNDCVTVEVEITENGTVRLTIDELRLDGIVDDDGNWELEITINGFGSLINEESKDTLKTAGCPLGKKFAKIEGQVTPPTMSGEVNGKLSCKVFFVTAGTLDVSGTLTAAK